MKIRNRSDLIKGLWAEWDKHRNDPTASFIYQYIKEEKDKEACRLTARDIRDYLNAARNEKTSVEDGTEKKGNLSGASTETKKHKKQSGSNGKYVLRKGAEILKSLGKISAAEYNEICSDISGKEEILIKGLVDDFFRNEGIRTKTVKDSLTSQKDKRVSFEEKKSKYRDYIELENRFLEKSNAESKVAEGDSFAGNYDTCLEYNKITEAMSWHSNADRLLYIKKCEALYELMLHDKTMEEDDGRKKIYCLVPLYVDMRSGASVVIMGKSYFYMGSILERKCYPVVLNWHEVNNHGKNGKINIYHTDEEDLKDFNYKRPEGIDKDDRIDVKRRKYEKWRNYNNRFIFEGKSHSDFTVGMQPVVFDEVGKAFEYLDSIISKNDNPMDEDDNNSVFGFFRDLNSFFIKGADPVFADYFESVDESAEEDMDEFADEQDKYVREKMKNKKD